jgi:hypothetical protein
MIMVAVNFQDPQATALAFPGLPIQIVLPWIEVTKLSGRFKVRQTPRKFLLPAALDGGWGGGVGGGAARKQVI